MYKMTEEISYSNPRREAVIENWPAGFNKRVTATFAIETKVGKGERATRLITGASKALTYCRKVMFVDGSDGKTYILCLSPNAEHISVMQSNMKFQHEVLWPRDPRYAATRAFLETEF